MPPFEPHRQATSREQVSRIDRGYYKRGSRLRTARAWLITAGVVLAAGWCAWGAIDPVRHHAPGPVIAAHARWERDCQACHVPLTPIKSDTFLSSDVTRSTMDAKCEACHRSAPHHPLQVVAQTGECASCHVDHRGRAADISRVADRTCTACHADINAHRLVEATGTAAGVVVPSTVTAPITRFDDEHHPPFASLVKDPGTLKFSHGRHMTAGLVFGGPSKTQPLTYAMLAEADRARVMPMGAAAQDPVQLSCASCHEFAPGTPPDDIRRVTALLTASKPGAYALPVSFERHCVACHKLPYEPDGTGGSLPHGLDAEATRRFILTALLEKSPSAEAALDAPAPPRALPANRPPANPQVETLRDELRGKVDASRSFARGGCGKCHDVADVELPRESLLGGAEAAGGGRGETEIWFRVPPVGVPDVWLTKARFDHGPHRSFECRLCHEAAYSSPSDTMAAEPAVAALSPLDNSRVMIAGRESCTACHAPPGIDAAGATVGGARFDCVECHGYHGLAPHHVPALQALGFETAGPLGLKEPRR
jgi:hypothetical protein